MSLKKIVLIGLTLAWMVPYSALAAGNGNRSENEKESFDWNPVIAAIIQVESNGNHRAKNGNQIGVMQITPILVADCNQILKKKKSKLRYTLSDRLNVKKSKEMFLIIQEWYNPQNNVEKAIRSWNGGMNYSVKGTQKYYEKVIRCMQDFSN